jgi:predicted GNAT family acetyltransferase
MMIYETLSKSEKAQLEKVKQLPKNIVAQYDKNLKFDTFIVNNMVIITAILNNVKVGDTLFDRRGHRLISQQVFVSPYSRGQGIAKKMYDYIKSLGFTIERSKEQTTAGKAFWNKYRGPDAKVWEGMNKIASEKDSITFKHFISLSENLENFDHMSEKDVAKLIY